MTVCIAAICKVVGQRMIVGASDRMLTAGDIEFEPPQAKVYPLTDKAVVMTAGDAAAQATLCADTVAAVNRQGLMEVADISDVYARQFSSFRLREAEAAILAPLGLDMASFTSQQAALPTALVFRLVEELRAYKLDAGAIIAGVDSTGPHIYVAGNPGWAACHDAVGFAAIGWGEWHAQSQFMFNQYTKDWAFARTLLLTYAAKKRAEVAPGVGRATDMFVIIKRYTAVHDIMVQDLEKMYAESRQKEAGVAEETLKKAEQYVEEFLGPTGTDEETAGGEPEHDSATDQGNRAEDG